MLFLCIPLIFEFIRLLNLNKNNIYLLILFNILN